MPHSWKRLAQIFLNPPQTLRLQRTVVPKEWLQPQAGPSSALSHLWGFMLHSRTVPSPFRFQFVISPQQGPQHAATSLEFTFPSFLCPSQFQKGNSELTLGFSPSTITQGPIRHSHIPQQPGKAGDLAPPPPMSLTVYPVSMSRRPL